jgi:hypothetical protein
VAAIVVVNAIAALTSRTPSPTALVLIDTVVLALAFHETRTRLRYEKTSGNP